MDAKGITILELSNIIGRERSLLKKILNDNYIPPKRTTLSIGVALGLSLRQMEVFLDKAGYSLNPSIEYEAKYEEVIQSCKGEGCWRIDECNDLLAEWGVPAKALFGNVKHIK